MTPCLRVGPADWSAGCGDQKALCRVILPEVARYNVISLGICADSSEGHTDAAGCPSDADTAEQVAGRREANQARRHEVEGAMP